MSPVAAQLASDFGSIYKAIQAGTGTLSPSDSPAERVDPNTFSSPFAGVGSLTITSGGNSYIGTAVAISPWYVLTAGHNLDTNDDGVVDTGISIGLSLNAGSNQSSFLSVSQFALCPGFTGFLNPSVTNDLGLLRLSQPLPAGVPVYPLWNAPLTVGQTFTTVGYGQSGSGDFGYSISASFSTKRVGGNVIDSFTQAAGQNAVFIYDFDAPATIGTVGGSLGNGVETIIGYGDSGSPLFLNINGQYYLGGINTFTQGSGLGLYGDQGGGIPLYPYLDWIGSTAGVAAVPEPATTSLYVGLVVYAVGSIRRRRKQRAHLPVTDDG